MITATVVGVERAIGNLRRAGQAMDRANRNVAVRGSILLRAMLVRQLTGPKGWDPFWGATSPGIDTLAARTGQTRARISPGGESALIHRGNVWEAAVGSPDAHVLLHEHGGTVGTSIIPTAAAQRRRTSERPGGRLRPSNPSGTLRWPGMRWSEIPGMFSWPSRRMRESKNPAVAAKYGAMKPWYAMVENGRLRLMALISPSATYRARGMFAAVQREIEPRIVEIGRAEVSLVVGAANA